MPRRIPSYPDAYMLWNSIASFGSIVSVVSTLVFFGVLLNLFWLKNRSNLTNANWFLNNNKNREFIFSWTKERTFYTRDNPKFSFVKPFFVVHTWTNSKGIEKTTAVKIDNWIHLNLDAPLSNQIGFQDPSTINFTAITDLHHDIMSIESVILGLVSWMMLYSYYTAKSRYANSLDKPFKDSTAGLTEFESFLQTNLIDSRLGSDSQNEPFTPLKIT